MRQHNLSWLALTETHIKQPDQFMIEGYTITHSATEIYDPKNKPTQTFTGVSLITAPSRTPILTDLTCIDGRFLHFTIDTAEAPLKIIVIYAPHNRREQPIRDAFWQQLTQRLTSHRERTPLLVVGDFNALALDEIAALPHAVGPHFAPRKTAEEDETDNTEEGDTNQRQFHDLLASQDYCLPQSWMEKASQTDTHRRPSGDRQANQSNPAGADVRRIPARLSLGGAKHYIRAPQTPSTHQHQWTSAPLPQQSYKQPSSN